MKHMHTHKSSAEAKKGIRPKYLLFYFLLICIPFLFLALVEIGLRIGGYGPDLRLFIPVSEELPQFLRINPQVSRRYFYLLSASPTPSKDLFLKEKPSNGYRIFVLGGSTTAGFPYGNNLTFSHILQKRLIDAFPERKIEVVNLAMAAICSYTLVDFMDEILEQKPDLILVYAGHNEFYGAMGVASMESFGRNPQFVRFYLQMERFRLFLLIRDTIGKIRIAVLKKKLENEKTGPVTLMERIVANPNIPYGSALYQKGKKQFESNLIQLVKKCKKARVPIVLSELVSNIRDQAPFASIDEDTTLSAQFMFQKARSLESQNRWEEARALYYRAKDLDPVRFRAPEDFNTIIHQIAEQMDVPVVPMKKAFELASPHGLIGQTLLCDHLHPNIDGYFVMADAFFNTLKTHGFISSLWKPNLLPSSFYRRHWGYTALDSLYGEIGIRFLKGGWPFRPKTLPHLGLSGYEPKTLPESLAVQLILEKNTGFTLELGHLRLAEYYEKKGEFEKAFQEYRALWYTIPHEILFYQKAVRVLSAMKATDSMLEVLQESLAYIDTPFAHRGLANLYIQKKQYREAIFHLQRALAFQPNQPELLYSLSVAYLGAGFLNEAWVSIQQLEREYPSYPGLAQLKKTFRKGLELQMPIREEVP